MLIEWQDHVQLDNGWYKSGHIEPTWNTDYKGLEYRKQPIKQDEVDAWRDQGYYNQSYSGVMRDSRAGVPEWCDAIGPGLGMYNCGYVIYCMSTLDIMPTHVDHFETYERIFNKQRSEIVRTLITLEDWKPGHYLEVAGKGYTNWSAGDFVMWTPEVPHAASNIGREPRWTLQVTGTLEP